MVKYSPVPLFRPYVSLNGTNVLDLGSLVRCKPSSCCSLLYCKPYCSGTIKSHLPYFQNLLIENLLPGTHNHWAADSTTSVSLRFKPPESSEHTVNTDEGYGIWVTREGWLLWHGRQKVCGETVNLSPVLRSKGTTINNQVLRLAKCDIGRTQVGRILGSLDFK
jgi:hypothetical protein